jgi:hypothetical protein
MPISALDHKQTLLSAERDPHVRFVPILLQKTVEGFLGQ